MTFNDDSGCSWDILILRKGQDNDCGVALTWTPAKRGREASKTTWQRPVEAERTCAGGRSWNDVRATASDRGSWQKCVEDFVATKWTGEGEESSLLCCHHTKTTPSPIRQTAQLSLSEELTHNRNWTLCQLPADPPTSGAMCNSLRANWNLWPWHSTWADESCHMVHRQVRSHGTQAPESSFRSAMHCGVEKDHNARHSCMYQWPVHGLQPANTWPGTYQYYMACHLPTVMACHPSILHGLPLWPEFAYQSWCLMDISSANNKVTFVKDFNIIAKLWTRSLSRFHGQTTWHCGANWLHSSGVALTCTLRHTQWGQNFWYLSAY